jgi:phage protein D
MEFSVSIKVNGSRVPELTGANVEVIEKMGATTQFKLFFEIDIETDDLPFLVDGRLDAGSEITLLVNWDGRDVCLVKGLVRGQRIHLQRGGQGSLLEVIGADTSIKMDRVSKTTEWPDVTDSETVKSILKSYDYTPDVQSTAANHSIKKHSLVQRATDLRFVRRLATRNGFLFWVSSDEQGNETAHFRRPSLSDDPSAELDINSASYNIEQMDIEWDVERPTSVEVTQLNLNDKRVIDGSVAGTPQVALGAENLAAITGDTRSTYLTAPADDGGDLVARGEGVLIEMDWFIRASCTTTLEALGNIVRAHTLVNVSGAGSRYSGKYFVSAVRHEISKEQYRMGIELIRNAWG